MNKSIDIENLENIKKPEKFDYANPLFLAKLCAVAYASINSELANNFIKEYDVVLTEISHNNVYGVIADNKVLAFRGSEIPTTKNGIFDWLNDLNAIPTVDGIHSGFDFAARSISKQVPDTIEVLTGHSLGGAIAVALSLLTSTLKITNIITFGCPRVAHKTLNHVVAYAHYDDPVPKLPLFYSFVGNPHMLGTHDPKVAYNPVLAVSKHMIHNYISLLGG